MSVIKLGTKLLIRTQESIDKKTGLVLDSVFEEMFPDNSFLMTAPIHKGLIYPLSIDSMLYISFNTEESLYYFTCKVSNRPIIKNIFFIEARLLSDIIRSQRRDHFRMKKILKGKLTQAGNIVSDCLTDDVSGGGVFIYTKEHSQTGDLLTVSLPVGSDGDMMDFNAQVMWRKTSGKEEYPYSKGLKFIYENEHDVEHMEKYVFDLQYERLKNINLDNRSIYA